MAETKQASSLVGLITEASDLIGESSGFTGDPDAGRLIREGIGKLWQATEVASAQASRIEELEKALAFYRDGFHPTPHKRLPGLEWKPSEALLDDCGNIARSVLSGSRADG